MQTWRASRHEIGTQLGGDFYACFANISQAFEWGQAICEPLRKLATRHLRHARDLSFVGYRHHAWQYWLVHA